MDDEKYFFGNNVAKEQDDLNRSFDILKKALKLKRASLLGDNKDFAKIKYDEFLMDNNLDNSSVDSFERSDIKQPVKKQTFNVMGMEFDSKDDFKDYFLKLSLKDKFNLVVLLIKNK